MKIEHEPIEGVRLTATYHPFRPATRTDPPEGDYCDDLNATVGGVDITELLHEVEWLERLAEVARNDIQAAYERQHEPE